MGCISFTALVRTIQTTRRQGKAAKAQAKARRSNVSVVEKAMQYVNDKRLSSRLEREYAETMAPPIMGLGLYRDDDADSGIGSTQGSFSHRSGKSSLDSWSSSSDSSQVFARTTADKGDHPLRSQGKSMPTVERERKAASVARSKRAMQAYQNHPAFRDSGVDLGYCPSITQSRSQSRHTQEEQRQRALKTLSGEDYHSRAPSSQRTGRSTTRRISKRVSFKEDTYSAYRISREISSTYDLPDWDPNEAYQYLAQDEPAPRKLQRLPQSFEEEMMRRAAEWVAAGEYACYDDSWDARANDRTPHVDRHRTIDMSRSVGPSRQTSCNFRERDDPKYYPPVVSRGRPSLARSKRWSVSSTTLATDLRYAVDNDCSDDEE